MLFSIKGWDIGVFKFQLVELSCAEQYKIECELHKTEMGVLQVKIVPFLHGPSGALGNHM